MATLQSTHFSGFNQNIQIDRPRLALVPKLHIFLTVRRHSCVEGNRQMRGGFQSPRRKPLQAIDPIGNRFAYLKFDKSEVGQLVDFSADYLMREMEEER
jgi:hypothetical protein